MTAQIENNFTYHAADAYAAQFKNVRYLLKQAAMVIEESCPDGREKALALTKLEEAMMWANAGIARQAPSTGE